MNKTELNRWKKRLILFLHNYKYVLLVALVGGFLLLLPPLWGENDGEPAAAENSSQTEEEAAYSAETLERRLEEALSKIEGAGEVEVR